MQNRRENPLAPSPLSTPPTTATPSPSSSLGRVGGRAPTRLPLHIRVAGGYEQPHPGAISFPRPPVPPAPPVPPPRRRAPARKCQASPALYLTRTRVVATFFAHEPFTHLARKHVDLRLMQRGPEDPLASTFSTPSTTATPSPASSLLRTEAVHKKRLPLHIRVAGGHEQLQPRPQLRLMVPPTMGPRPTMLPPTAPTVPWRAPARKSEVIPQCAPPPPLS